MISTQQRVQLQRQIWQIANEVRGELKDNIVVQIEGDL